MEGFSLSRLFIYLFTIFILASHKGLLFRAFCGGNVVAHGVGTVGDFRVHGTIHINAPLHDDIVSVDRWIDTAPLFYGSGRRPRSVEVVGLDYDIYIARSDLIYRVSVWG